MTHELKNPLMKNSRHGKNFTNNLLRLYLRGWSIGAAAAMLELPKPTVARIFNRTHARLFQSIPFVTCMRTYIAWARLDGTSFMLTRALSVEPKQLFGCVRHCDTNTPPLKVRSKIRDLESKDQMRRICGVMKERESCTYCLMKLPLRAPPAGVVLHFAETEDLRSTREALQKKASLHTDLSPMESWSFVVAMLGKHRKLSKDNIRGFVLEAALAASIQACDIPIDRDPANDHFRYAVPNHLRNDFSDPFACHYENALEAAVHVMVEALLMDNPL